jgi:hypothetical protein
MRDKILAELNKKYLGLSKKVLGLLADNLVKTVTEESQIEGAVAALDNLPITPKEYAEFVQKEGDARVTEALKKAKPEKEAGDNDDPPKDESNPADPNAKLMKMITDLSNKVDGFQKEKVQTTLSQKLQAALTEKKIPLQLAKGRVIEKEEDLETALADIEADWTTIKQENANAGFSSTSTPVGGGVNTVKPDAAAADIKSWADKGKAQAVTATSKN